MALTLAQTLTAVAPGIISSFQGIGGVSPYSYSVRNNGAGGSINSSGIYTAPAQMGTSLQTLYDVIQVVDNVGAVAISKILVANPVFLLCDIIQTQLGLASDHVFLWDQKLFSPTDSSLWVAVSVPKLKPFGNNISYDSSGNKIQVGNFLALVDVDIFSRGSAARDQKELVVLAIMSDYSIQQQEANSFTIGRLPTEFRNLSEIDGAAIPYRYNISFQMQYAASTSGPTSYFNQFANPTVYTNA
jgi:hypothetical protein